MRNRIKRRQVDVDFDKKILVGMIVSDSYCSDISRVIDLQYFKTDYARKIAKWILQYHKRYKEAPKNHIKDIFEAEQETLKEEEADLIKSFLREISNQYENDTNFEKSINTPYLFDQTIEYFKERAVTKHAEEIQALLSVGKIDEAEVKIRNYKNVAKVITQWIDPFKNKVIDRVFDVDEANNLFKFPGALGSMMGYLKRGWLIGFMAPMKRGKSWWLLSIAILAVMAGYKTVFISLEMSEEEILERIYKIISALADEDCEMVYPCFDCYKNQDDSCNKQERRGHKRLLYEDGTLPDYSPSIRHKVCTSCRENHSSDFVASTWFTQHHVKKMTKARTKAYAKGLQTMFGNNLRVIAFPINTANTGDVRNELENLEYTENFVASVGVLDYADILGSEIPGLSGRDKVNETWLMLKNLAQTKHMLWATGTQSSRKSIYKKNVMQDDTSEDIRKLAHVNAMFSLNQTETEELLGIMRVGVTVHRHKKSSERKNVIVLGNLDVGQPILDSSFADDKKREVKITKNKSDES